MKRFVLKRILQLHNLCYRLAGPLAVRVEGQHPKHRLMRYKEWFLDHVRPDDVVLDVGSNTGNMPTLIAPNVEYVYGVEIDHALVAQARANNRYDNVEYIASDATTLDLSLLRPISVVTMSNVLEHIDARVDLLSALARRLPWRDSGERRILIRVPMIDRDWITLYKRELGLNWRLDPTHYTEYTLDQFHEELAAAGIKVDSADIRFGEIYAVCHVG